MSLRIDVILKHEVVAEWTCLLGNGQIAWLENGVEG